MANEKKEVLTADELAKSIKKRHNVKGAVFCLEIPGSEDNEGQTFTGWVRKPNLDEMGAFMSMGQSNPVQATQVMLNSIWLEGDEIIRTNDECFLSAMGILDEIIQIQVATIKKF